jgi:hypothetical protein
MNNTKKCRYCNTDIDKVDKICPNCKRKQGFPTWAIVLIVAFFIFCAIGYDKDDVNTESIETNALANTTSSTENVTKAMTNTSTKADTSQKVDTNSSTSVDTNIMTSTTTSPSNTESDKKNYTVYITKTGKKYHSSGCRYLSKSCIESDLNSAVASGLEPCSVCNP